MTSNVEKRLKFILFLGSVREKRMNTRVALFVKRLLEEANHEVEIFDPLLMPFPLVATPLHYYPDRNEAPSWLLEANNKIVEADGFVVVSSEYNHCIPPVLSNMLDHFPQESYSFKPCAIVTYSTGLFGGKGAAMQLRCLLGELGCLSVSRILAIPKVHEAIDESGTLAVKNERLSKRAHQMADQLRWVAMATRNHRHANGIPLSSVEHA